jgi:hypothetical protein
MTKEKIKQMSHKTQIDNFVLSKRVINRDTNDIEDGDFVVSPESAHFDFNSNSLVINYSLFQRAEYDEGIKFDRHIEPYSTGNIGISLNKVNLTEGISDEIERILKELLV